MLDNAEQVNPARLDLYDERDIQPLQRHGVGVEEVDRKQAAGLGAQEGAPGVVAARGWRHPAGTQDLTDGRGGYPIAETTQFALDANHAPGPVLPRQAHDQGGQLLADRRTARRLRQRPASGSTAQPCTGPQRKLLSSGSRDGRSPPTCERPSVVGKDVTCGYLPRAPYVSRRVSRRHVSAGQGQMVPRPPEPLLLYGSLGR